MATELDLLKNRNALVPLGPFDSKVGAVVKIAGESYYITTNTDYIPALQIREDHAIQLREDFRYGDNDPTLWPQQYSQFFCHLAAIHKKMPEKMNVSIMWWDVSHANFICPDTGRSITRGMGKLRPERFSALTQAVSALLDEYHAYEKSLAPNKPLALFAALIKQLKLGLERLQTLPSTYTRMAVAITQLQRNFLELHTLLRYMSIYKPRMEAIDDTPHPYPDKCIGAFVSDPAVAQRFHAAGLPYWLIRPTWSFMTDNILEIVTPMEPDSVLNLARSQNFRAIQCGIKTDEKIHALRAAGAHDSWYNDPFNSSTSEVPSPPSLAGPSAALAGDIGQEVVARTGEGAGRGVGRRRPDYVGGADPRRGVGRGGRGAERHTPYPQPVKGSSGHDKFKMLEREEMPPAVGLWEEALEEVDRTAAVVRHRTTDGRYVFPKPALLVSQIRESKRQLELHHYSLIRDALLYRMGDPDDPTHSCPPRNVHGRSGETKAAARSNIIDVVLGPAMRACGLSQYHDFPAAENSVPHTTVNCAREIIWDVADSNFRFEFVGLDHRASGLSRLDQCCECFAGGMLMGMPISMAKKGLAAIASSERHPYILRMAKLMRDWSPRPPRMIMDANEDGEWGETERCALELAVATHYTQTFYEFFGRAAVIPMRIEHELVT
ncbi:hypothetical protein DFH07DRAFT_779742 [Mycena maculata]|uniref:Uncharacterized protein n=1 Tax=Mycena maculata TaxID=230809 RepID=A0AAD7I6Z9_9AGAR|nr:hypothetical protein DFH07DRAFT_779742 [Mycena maculata]